MVLRCIEIFRGPFQDTSFANVNLNLPTVCGEYVALKQFVVNMNWNFLGCVSFETICFHKIPLAFQILYYSHTRSDSTFLM